MSSHTSLLTQLVELKAATQAAATVMGPKNDDLCATIAHNTELMTQLKAALTNDQLTGEQLAQLLTNRILDPARQSGQQQQQSTLDAIDKGFDTAKTSMAVNLLNRVIYSDVSKVRVNYFLLE